MDSAARLWHNPAPMRPAAILLLLAALTAAPRPAFALCDDWSRQDTVLQAADAALRLTDWAQTRVALADRTRHELNSQQGGHPSAAEINLYSAEAIGTDLLVSCLLSPANRTLWQAFLGGYELHAVWFNHQVGVRLTGSF